MTKRNYDFPPVFKTEATPKGTTRYFFLYCENGDRKRKKATVAECSCPPRRGNCEHFLAAQQEFEFFKDRVTAVQRGDLVSIPKALTEYLATIQESKDHTEGTKFIIKNNLDFFASFCMNSGILHLADFTEDQGRAFGQWLKTLKYATPKGREKKYAEATLHIILRNTRAFFSFSVHKKYIMENPFSGANKLKSQKLIQTAPEKPKNILKNEEVKKLESKLEGQWLNIFQLFIYTGMRMDDLRLLKWERISGTQISLYEDEESGYRPKWNINRAILITPKIEAILKAQKKYQKDNKINSPYVFTTSVSTPYNPNNIRRFFKKSFDKYDIKGTLNNGDLYVHTFRHTYITNLLKAGIPLPVVSKAVGHSSVKMTMAYFQALPEDQEVIKNFSY